MDTGESPPQMTTLRESVHTPTRQVWSCLDPSQLHVHPDTKRSDLLFVLKRQ